MTPEQLKASVLQYAMQGKLVPQDPTDEPASELIKRIKAEKEQLIKEKKIKKEKPLPEITDEEKPFEIPESWEWVRLGNLIRVSSGKQLKTDALKSNGGIQVFGANGIIGNYDESNVLAGKIIIGRVGFYAGSIHYTNNNSWVTDNALIVDHNNHLLTDMFLIFLLKFTNLKKLAQHTAQPVISGTRIYGVSVVLPPIGEQKRIVQKIEELFEKIDQYAESYNKLEELNKQFPVKMEKSLLQYAMQGKLVPQNPSDEPASELLKQIKAEKEQLIKDKKIKKEKPLPEITDEEIPFEIPESWEWRRLREFSVITSGGTPKTAISEYWEGNIPWITPKDMGKQREKYIKSSSKKITDYGLEKSSAQLIRKNSIVYSSRAPIGHINIVPFDYTTNQGCKSVSPIRINIEYLYYSLIMMTPNIIKRGSGTTFKEVSATTFGETLIPIPPLNEQIRIIRELENIVKTVNNLKI